MYMCPGEKEKYIREFLVERMDINGAPDLTNTETALIVNLSKMSINPLNDSTTSLLELIKMRY
jgi:hypothetical protein